jgi:hypothetical protein
MEKYKYLKFDQLEEDASVFVTRTLGLVNLQFIGALSDVNYNVPKITKSSLSKVLADALRIIDRQSKYIESLEGQAQQLKSEMIVNQGAVIDLQKEMLEANRQQLNDLQANVVASVEDTVKNEMKLYSDAAKTDTTNSGVFLDKKTLTSVVHDVVSEEDRSRNIMIFGLTEQDNEQINVRVSQVLLELGEKPKVEATRIGGKHSKPSKDAKTSTRPVKVTVSNSTIVRQILSADRALRHSEHYKEVFISPDRSAEQRSQHKELVLELKQRMKDDPDKKHYIKGGQLCSVDKK